MHFALHPPCSLSTCRPQPVPGVGMLRMAVEMPGGHTAVWFPLGSTLGCSFLPSMGFSSSAKLVAVSSLLSGDCVVGGMKVLVVSGRVIAAQSIRWEMCLFHSVLVMGPDVSVLIFHSQTPHSCDLLLYIYLMCIHLLRVWICSWANQPNTHPAQGCLWRGRAGPWGPIPGPIPAPQ